MVETVLEKARFVFDPSEIERAATRAKDRNLRRSGALLRTIARRSIGYRKNKKSLPGNPPFSHVKGSEFGLRSILWHHDRAKDTVIVGPIIGKDPSNALPGILEDGGRSRIELPPALRRKLGRKTVVTRIKARPTTGPAGAAFMEDYPALWKDAIS